MSTTTEPLLRDVRTAYRLLSEYQRMAISAAGYVGNSLGFRYGGGWPRLSNPAPRGGRGRLENWPWDWLNMVWYEFHFLQGEDPPSIRSLSLVLFGDTEVAIARGKGQPRVENLRPVEDSRTMMGVFFSQGNRKRMDFLRNPEKLRDFLENGSVLREFEEPDGSTVYGKCYDFDRFASREQADAVIEELVQVSKGTAVHLERSMT